MIQTITKEEYKTIYKEVADSFLHKCYRLEKYEFETFKLINNFYISRVSIKKHDDGTINSVTISDNNDERVVLYNNIWQELVNTGEYESEINGNLYKESIINYLEGIV